MFQARLLLAAGKAVWRKKENVLRERLIFSCFVLFCLFREVGFVLKWTVTKRLAFYESDLSLPPLTRRRREGKGRDASGWRGRRPLLIFRLGCEWDNDRSRGERRREDKANMGGGKLS